VLLDVCISNDEGGGWIDGEELLPDLLPLYDEIKEKNYQWLVLVAAILSVGDKISLLAIFCFVCDINFSPHSIIML